MADLPQQSLQDKSLQDNGLQDISSAEDFPTNVERLEKEVMISDYISGYIDVEKFEACCEKCGNYGKKWSCPPYDFAPLNIWQSYSKIHLICYRFYTRAGESEADALQELKALKKRLRKEIISIEQRSPHGRGLLAGSCELCPNCARVLDKPCRFPDKMRYSIESLGGDVVKTVHDFFGIEIKWSRKKGEAAEYYVLCGGILQL